MVTLRVEGRGKSENVGRTKLNTKSAGFAALNFDLDGTFCWHEFLKRNLIAPMWMAKANLTRS
jgi:hypothetical protein